MGLRWILIGWFIKLSVQAFQPLIVIFRRVNFCIILIKVYPLSRSYVTDRHPQILFIRIVFYIIKLRYLCILSSLFYKNNEYIRNMYCSAKLQQYIWRSHMLKYELYQIFKFWNKIIILKNQKYNEPTNIYCLQLFCR